MALGSRVGILVIVTGPPCSGKSTYVRSSWRDGDALLDLDALQEALGSSRSHGHEDTWLPLALAARKACLREWLERRQGNLWYISCRPSPEEELSFPSSAKRVVLDTSLEECLRRARAGGRGEPYAAMIEKWFARPRPAQPTIPRSFLGSASRSSMPF